MSLTTKVVTPSAEEMKKFGDRPATNNKSAFVAGSTFTIKELGWRQLIDETTGLPVLSQNDNLPIFFPVLETSLGEKASLTTGLFEPKWDEKLNRVVIPSGPIAEFFRENCTKMTKQEILQAIKAQFDGVTFEVSLVFYNRANKDGNFFRASAPVFAMK